MGLRALRAEELGNVKRSLSMGDLLAFWVEKLFIWWDCSSQSLASVLSIAIG